MKALIEKSESKKIKAILNTMPIAWRKKILKSLKESENKEIVDILE